MAKYLLDSGGPDASSDLGALKIFAIPDDPSEKAKALARLGAEVSALTKLEELRNPAILKILNAHIYDGHFIVTEFHRHGSLDKHLSPYRGNAISALSALRPLVAAVNEIHKLNAIHRDIKTENIFVSEDHRLVLGDFGIVFFKDSAGRLTSTYERVGSHFWMAPWAYKNQKLALEDVNPTLDIYPLGKVLWSLIAGHNGFAYWEYDRKENNLELFFPDDPAMPVINEILSKCVVREERDCIPSADALLTLVDAAVEELQHLGQKPKRDKPWPCLICGRGHYVREQGRSRIGYERDRDVSLGAYGYAVFICDQCGHCQLFRDQVGQLR